MSSSRKWKACYEVEARRKLGIMNGTGQLFHEAAERALCRAIGFCPERIQGAGDCGREWHTAYAELTGKYDAWLAFCMERKLMGRLADEMLGEPVADEDDIRECMRECVNIILGDVVSSMFRMTGASARFPPPLIAEGRRLPAAYGENEINVTRYIVNCPDPLYCCLTTAYRAPMNDGRKKIEETDNDSR